MSEKLGMRERVASSYVLMLVTMLLATLKIPENCSRSFHSVSLIKSSNNLPVFNFFAWKYSYWVWPITIFIASLHSKNRTPVMYHDKNLVLAANFIFSRGYLIVSWASANNFYSLNEILNFLHTVFIFLYMLSRVSDFLTTAFTVLLRVWAKQGMWYVFLKLPSQAFFVAPP